MVHWSMSRKAVCLNEMLIVVGEDNLARHCYYTAHPYGNYVVFCMIMSIFHMDGLSIAMSEFLRS